MNTTISWLYDPDPTSSCVVTKYRVGVYRYNDIVNAESESSLQSFTDFEIFYSDDFLLKMVTISSRYLHGGTNFFRLFALNTNNVVCDKSTYFYNLTFDGKSI